MVTGAFYWHFRVLCAEGCCEGFPSFVDLGKECIGLHSKNYKVLAGHIEQAYNPMTCNREAGSLEFVGTIAYIARTFPPPKTKIDEKKLPRS